MMATVVFICPRLQLLLSSDDAARGMENHGELLYSLGQNQENGPFSMRAKPIIIPRFYLYGEPPREVDHHFAHLETIKDRSGPIKGVIRAHSHADLNHIFLITKGKGTITADERDLRFDGAHVLFIPAGTVHGFHFGPAVEGYVLTLASAYLRAFLSRRTGLEDFGTDVKIIPLKGRAGLNGLRQWILRLQREMFWNAPAQRAAIEVNLTGLLIDIHRLSHHQDQTLYLPARPHLKLMAQFHELIEAHHKNHLPLSGYLSLLKATESQLRYACEKAGEKAPMQMILDRRLIEAKRLLIYSDMSIADCGISAGFDDPAYFSRLFAKSAGLPPKAYRIAHRADEAAGL
jgi:AraC family transcriptional regulator, transcriptional activator of pobA